MGGSISIILLPVGMKIKIDNNIIKCVNNNINYTQNNSLFKKKKLKKKL